MANSAIKSLLLAILVSSCALRVSGESRQSDKESHLRETARYNIPLSGTTRLDSLSSSVANVWSTVGSGLIAALLVTAGVYVLGLGGEGLLGGSRVSRRVSSGGHYDGHYDGQHHYGGHYGGQHQDRWGRRQEGVAHQLAKIMSALSVDSVQDLVSGVKHGILGRLSSVRDDSLKRVDDVQNSITNTIDTGFEAIGGGSKLEDCFLQAVCYLTPDDEEEGESRKLNKDKQRRREEKRRQKQNKKKNKSKKKKVEVVQEDDEYYEDYDEDYEEEVTESSDNEDDYDTNEDGKVTSDDCQVFKCDIVKHGYTAFQLYNKVQNLRSQISSLREDAEEEF